MEQFPAIRITLIHGTWGRGLPFLARRRSRPAKWCRAGSGFRQALEAALARKGLKATFQTFEWSGANSFRERDRSASRLAETLAAHDAESPHLLVAHSHGGNVALRALQILMDGERPTVALSVATIATPFIHIRFEELPRAMKLIGAYLCLCLIILWLYIQAAALFGQPMAPLTIGFSLIYLVAGGGFISLFLSVQLVSWMHDWSQSVAAAGYYTQADELAPLLVIRGTEDEATMVLVLGLIGVRLSDLVGLLTTFGFVIIFVGFVLVAAVSSVIVGAKTYLGVSWQAAWLPSEATVAAMYDLAFRGGLALIAIMLLPGLFKAVFGRELLRGNSALSVTANSVPDVGAKATVITLNRDGQGESALLHALYDHPDCASAIAGWLKRLDARYRFEKSTGIGNHK